MNGNETGPDLREQLDVLVGRHGKKWLHFVKRMLGNAADAEDVLQEAVHRVLAKELPFATEEHARLYLARAISNTAIAMYHARKRERQTHVPLQDNLMTAQAPSETILDDHQDTYETRQLLRLLQDGLSRLTVKQYEAIRLTVLDPSGSSIRDAGLVNGIPYSTLRHRSVQGIRRLRRYVYRALRSSAKIALHV
jgi:RNA polymerase sigma factor (sigma-70 family)